MASEEISRAVMRESGNVFRLALEVRLSTILQLGFLIQAKNLLEQGRLQLAKEFSTTSANVGRYCKCLR